MRVITYEIAMAAARDAGNRHMRKNGRTSWNGDDYDVACDEMNRLGTHIALGNPTIQAVTGECGVCGNLMVHGLDED